MSWFGKSAAPPKLSYWDQLDVDYPPGSEWLYLGKPVVILRTHTWDPDGCPWFEPRVQYVDHQGDLVTAEVCLEALKPLVKPGRTTPLPGGMADMVDGKYVEKPWMTP